jgi:hypothetical protein
MLAAGTYVFQLADSLFRRHLVQVLDQHRRILAMVVTIPAIRPRSMDNARIAFDETPAGSPHRTKAWLYPGCLDGEEFLRPNRSKSAITD